MDVDVESVGVDVAAELVVDADVAVEQLVDVLVVDVDVDPVMDVELAEELVVDVAGRPKRDLGIAEPKTDPVVELVVAVIGEPKTDPVVEPVVDGEVRPALGLAVAPEVLLAGASSSSVSKPTQFLCSGKLMVTLLPLFLMPVEKGEER